MGKKGYIYTVLSIIFALLLIGVLSLYYEMHRNTANVAPQKLRTDELHYFIESSKKDIGRAMTISSGRAAVYLTDYIVNSGSPVSDPQQKLKELMLNGTITISGSTTNVKYMENHTLNKWLNQTKRVGSNMSFDVIYNFSSLDIYAFDSWHFLSILTLKANVSDKKGMCWYEEEKFKIYSMTPIYGLEDVLYPLQTTNKVKRYFAVSSWPSQSATISVGGRGGGVGGGLVLDISADDTPARTETDNNIIQYNISHPELVNKTVFVLNLTDFDAQMSDKSKTILNDSAGVINHYDLDLGGRGFPYVSDIPEGVVFTNVSYIAIRNAGQHQLLFLSVIKDVSDRLYYPSFNGSSFFDRLEGNMNASDKYKTQAQYARALFNLDPETEIGLVGFVNVSEFVNYRLFEVGNMPAFVNQSSADYEYFQNVSGRWVYGTPEWFRLDPLNLNKFNLTEFCYDRNLSAAWYMNEGTGSGVYDSSRMPENGVLHSAVWVPGKIGNAIHFDGVNDNVSVQDPRGSLDLNQSLTLNAWVNLSSSLTGSGTIIARTDGTKRPYRLSVSNTGLLTFDFTFNNGLNTVSRSKQLPLDGKWHHVAATRDVGDGSAVLYIDGSPVDSGSYFGTPDSVPAADDVLRIGMTPGGAADPFKGEIDEVKLWDRALSEEEVKDEYERGWKTY